MRSQKFSFEVPEVISGTDDGARLRWRVLHDHWLTIRPLRSGLSYSPGLEDSQITHQVALRFHSEIAVGGRFRKGARVLVVHTLMDVDDRHRRLVCLCQENSPTLTGFERRPG